MPVPILCLDEEVRHFAERFQKRMSKPQDQYLVTVRLRLMLCEGTRTLSGRLRQVGNGPSLAGLSRFLSEARSQSLGRKLAEALSRNDAVPGHSRPAATTPKATEASRPSKPPVGSSLSDRGRLDDAQAQSQEDGRAGAASFDD